MTPIACNCGRYYKTPEEVTMCLAHNCGSLQIKWDAQHKSLNCFDIEVKNFCAECEFPLLTKMKFKDGMVTLHTLPHVCAVPDPEND